jgi:polysaccharide pyruvyl transferase WcaK-like protein
MIRVLATGARIEDNFGGPSVLHGLKQVLDILYGNNYELVYCQLTPFDAISASDFDFSLRTLIFGKKQIGLKYFTDRDMSELKSYIRSSDIVVDLYGICFSDNLEGDQGYIKSYISLLYQFRVSILAKLYRKKVVKNTCSFGPMKNKSNLRKAKFACRYLFNILSAREEKSRLALLHDAKVKKEILLSPDIANVMPFQKKSNTATNIIGISTSHQIIRQWKNEEGYIECMVNLCKHVSQKYQKPILLIPNEVQKSLEFNDISVSEEIQKKLCDEGISVDIADSAKMPGSELKNLIASCEVMVASRYHSCVASLSSGVPVLVVGWHYKYEELLHWYYQDQWILSNKDCSSARLIEMFDAFWEQRDTSKKIIAENYPKVQKAVLDTAKIMFSR